MRVKRNIPPDKGNLSLTFISNGIPNDEEAVILHKKDASVVTYTPQVRFLKPEGSETRKRN